MRAAPPACAAGAGGGVARAIFSIAWRVCAVVVALSVVDFTSYLCDDWLARRARAPYGLRLALLYLVAALALGFALVRARRRAREAAGARGAGSGARRRRAFEALTLLWIASFAIWIPWEETVKAVFRATEAVRFGGDSTAGVVAYGVVRFACELLVTCVVTLVVAVVATLSREIHAQGARALVVYGYERLALGAGGDR